MTWFRDNTRYQCSVQCHNPLTDAITETCALVDNATYHLIREQLQLPVIIRDHVLIDTLRVSLNS